MSISKYAHIFKNVLPTREKQWNLTQLWTESGTFKYFSLSSSVCCVFCRYICSNMYIFGKLLNSNENLHHNSAPWSPCSIAMAAGWACPVAIQWPALVVRVFRLYSLSAASARPWRIEMLGGPDQDGALRTPGGHLKGSTYSKLVSYCPRFA